MDLATIRRSKRVEKHSFGGLQGYAAGAARAFRTVSEGGFSEVRNRIDGLGAEKIRHMGDVPYVARRLCFPRMRV